MLSTKLNQPEAVQLADAFCAESRERIAQLFRQLYGAHDEQLYKVAMSVLKGEHAWMEKGIAWESWYAESVSRVKSLESENPQYAVHGSELQTAGSQTLDGRH
jgi:hypothetical protein